MGWNGFYVNMDWSGLGWAEMDWNKTSRSHYKILSKLTEICCRWLSMTRSYSVQSSVDRVPRQEPDPINKILRSHYKILSKLTEICCKWLSMTRSYSVQSSVARITRGSHVKSRTLEIKSRVHIIKFYRTWLKFIVNDSVWLGATLCKAAWLELHMGPTSGAGF